MAHLQLLKKEKANISRLRKVVSAIVIFALMGGAVLGIYTYQLSKNNKVERFRVEAKKAGYSDQEIDEYLLKKKGLCRVYSTTEGKFEDIPCDEIKTNEPSERALKAAAYAYFAYDEKGRKELEQKMLATGSADLTIKNIARWLDNDLTKLISVETLMQKYQSNQGGNSGSTNTYNPAATIVRTDSNSESTLDKYQRESRQRCQEETNRYTVCLSEYNLKVNEYNECLSEQVTNEWKFCYKPINSCGFKPFCTY